MQSHLHNGHRNTLRTIDDNAPPMAQNLKKIIQRIQTRNSQHNNNNLNQIPRKTLQPQPQPQSSTSRQQPPEQSTKFSMDFTAHME